MIISVYMYVGIYDNINIHVGIYDNINIHVGIYNNLVVRVENSLEFQSFSFQKTLNIGEHTHTHIHVFTRERMIILCIRQYPSITSLKYVKIYHSISKDIDYSTYPDFSQTSCATK